MDYDEDQYDEDVIEAEFDDSFPDEEDERDMSRYEDSLRPELVGDLGDFLADPWPRVIFVLILIGFGFALIPPYPIWQQWNYYFIINYGIIIMATVAAVLSLRIWKLTSSRIRYGGLTNLIVVIVAAVIGTLDTISWVLFSQSIIPGTATPILSLAAVVILFSLYSLWIIQRSFQQNK